MADGISVGAHNDSGCGAVATRQGDVLVTRVVVGDLKLELFGPVGDETMREVLSVAVGDASDAGGIGGMFAQAGECILCLRDLGRRGHRVECSDARAIVTAQRTPSSTGTGRSPAIASAMPDNGPPPMITAPAPSSATAWAQASANASR